MQMEIAVELHSRWNLQSAIRIAEALEEIEPNEVRGTQSGWIAPTRVPVAASTILSTAGEGRGRNRDIPAACPRRRIAALAETYHRPVLPHDFNGPVGDVAGVHFCLAMPTR
ncbi:hypothetical protein ACVIHH_008293 [Bradyrhizobium sp. USDA 4518]